MKRLGVAAVAVGAFACTGAPTEPGEEHEIRAVSSGAAYGIYVPPALAVDSATAPAVTWDATLAMPRHITGWFPVRPGQSAEAAAREVLARHAGLFKLRADGSDLGLAWTRQGLAGTYVRFAQRAGGLPVFDHGVTVVVADDGSAVRAVALEHAPGLALAAGTTDVGAAAALAAARVRVGSPSEKLAPQVELGAQVARGAARRVYRVTVAAATPAATWEVMVAADDGAVLSARDTNRRVDGTGMVFDMNAVSSTGVTTLPDSNDQDSPALTAARFAVTLPRLDGSGFLRGMFADVKNPSSRAQEAGLAFNYLRADNRFEEAVVYYHLDRAQAHIQALGFTGGRSINNRVQVATVNDGNQDNSFYSPADKELSFGSGGVDDAEDGDIVLHEYGHSIQDNQVPGFGNGDEDAMGEGFGDYIAAAFSTVLPQAAGHAQPALPACVGDWDAISYDNGTPPCLRRVDGVEHYPERFAGESHDDGEIWSGALWRARATVGDNAMDTLVLESHFMLGTASTFDFASNAILMADQMLNAGANLPALREALYKNGMLRTLRPGAGFSMSTPEIVNVVNPTSGGLYANGIDHIQSITRPGAPAIRVHFATIATELDPGCVGGVCDNVYLYDAAGDLYQILGGTQSNVVSVQIPGDTVQIRLVADGSVQGAGYVIDRVDVMGGVQEVDAPLPIDAPPPIDAPRIDATPPVDIDAPAGDIDAPAGGPDAGDDPAKADDGGCCGAGGGAPGSVVLALFSLLVVLMRRRATT